MEGRRRPPHSSRALPSLSARCADARCRATAWGALLGPPAAGRVLAPDRLQVGMGLRAWRAPRQPRRAPRWRRRWRAAVAVTVAVVAVAVVAVAVTVVAVAVVAVASWAGRVAAYSRASLGSSRTCSRSPRVRPGRSAARSPTAAGMRPGLPRAGAAGPMAPSPRSRQRPCVLGMLPEPRVDKDRPWVDVPGGPSSCARDACMYMRRRRDDRGGGHRLADLALGVRLPTVPGLSGTVSATREPERVRLAEINLGSLTT
ncbi:hypothetical protein HNP84_004229 [Thermocatellispora tengchongensis]|uniref:Uncharacterized protein n=1 Tax=Thermocatellispora tengchongensis TaxID=1073253 RepID=A0A840PBD6_9ACTN|nr:hypothetical protein [Thermocatellispora tengchongensis]